jgi:hypothetical protein
MAPEPGDAKEFARANQRRRNRLYTAIHELRNWPQKSRNRRIRRMARVAIPIARRRIQAFRKLATISPEERRALVPRMIQYEGRLALIRAKETAMEESVSTPLIWFMMVIIIIMPYAISSWNSTWFGWLAFIGISYASLALFVTILLLLVSPLLIFSLFGMGRASAFIGLFCGVLGILACGYAFYSIRIHYGSNTLPWPILIFLSALAQILIFIFCWLAGLLLIFLPSRWVMSSFQGKRIPDAMFVDSLLRALETATMPDRLWGELITRNRLMRRLEEAARIADEKMPVALKSFDPFTDSWQRNRFGEIAASLRAKKQWVCMPKPDTRDRLLEALTSFFVDAAFGRWDRLETAQRMTRKRTALLRSLTVVQGIVLAFLPAALLYGAKHFRVLIDSEIDKYLEVGVILWAILGILFVMDPRLAEKVETAKTLRSLVPGLVQKKED